MDFNCYRKVLAMNMRTENTIPVCTYVLMQPTKMHAIVTE